MFLESINTKKNQDFKHCLFVCAWLYGKTKARFGIHPSSWSFLHMALLLKTNRSGDIDWNNYSAYLLKSTLHFGLE